MKVQYDKLDEVTRSGLIAFYIMFIIDVYNEDEIINWINSLDEEVIPELLEYKKTHKQRTCPIIDIQLN